MPWARACWWPRSSSPATRLIRLFDWNRVGPDGKPRPLHVEQGLAVVDFQRGPVDPQQPQPTDRPWVSRLVACDKFMLDRWDFDRPQAIGGDGRCHIVCVLEGAVDLEGDPAGGRWFGATRRCCPPAWARCV